MNKRARMIELYSKLMDDPSKMSVGEILELNELRPIDKHVLKTIERNFDGKAVNKIVCVIPKLVKEYIKLNNGVLSNELNTEEELEGFDGNGKDGVAVKNIWILSSDTKRTIFDIIMNCSIEEIKENKPLIAVLQHSNFDFEKLYRFLWDDDEKIQWLKDIELITTSIDDNVIARKIFNITEIDKEKVFVSNRNSGNRITQDKNSILSIRRLSSSYSQSVGKHYEQEEESGNILDNIQYSGQVDVQQEIDRGQQSTLQQNAITQQQAKTLAREGYSSSDVNLSWTDESELGNEKNSKQIDYNYDDVRQRTGSIDTPQFLESKIMGHGVIENKTPTSGIMVASDSEDIRHNKQNTKFKHEKQDMQDTHIQVGME